MLTLESRIDILILTALGEELKALQTLSTFQEIPSKFTGLTYWVGNVTSRETSLRIGLTCLHGMGNPNAAIFTNEALRELQPEYVIVFGIAGGVKSRISLGDVAVSTQIFYYEQAKVFPMKIELRPVSYETDSILRMRLQDFALKKPSKYEIKFGPFAVGEKVIADSSLLNRIIEYTPKLIAVEMESFGVAIAATVAQNRPRFISVRGISDYADSDKSDDWREIALTNAANFLLDFFQNSVLPNNNLTLTNLPATYIALNHLALYRRSSPHTAIDYLRTQRDAIRIEEISIDQTASFHDGRLFNIGEALERQIEAIHKLDDLIEKYPDSRIGYFGLAHIPLIFHLGFRVNRRDVEVFTTKRASGKWTLLPQHGSKWPPLCVENVPDVQSHNVNEVVILMCISYPIRDELISEVLSPDIPRIKISLPNPEPDVLHSLDQLNDYTHTFFNVLVSISNIFPDIDTIHLFYAGPPELAFRCGQQISSTIDPEIWVYNYSNKNLPRYRWSLCVNPVSSKSNRPIFKEFQHV